MKTFGILSAFLLSGLMAVAQLPTAVRSTNGTAVSLTVSNGLTISGTGNASIVAGGNVIYTNNQFTGDGGGLTNLQATNLLFSISNVFAGKVYTNGTGAFSGFNVCTFTALAGHQYICLITNINNYIGDANALTTFGTNLYGVPGGFLPLQTTSDVFVALDGNSVLFGQPVQEVLFEIIPNSGVFSNLIVDTLSNNVMYAGTIYGLSGNEGSVNPVSIPNGLFGGSFPNVANQIPLLNYFSLTNGVLPLHDNVVTRNLLVAPLWFSTYLNYGVTTLTGTAMSNIYSALNTNGLVSAGYNFVEVDAGWEQTNILRTPGSVLDYNHTNFPNGLRNVIAYGHSQGIKTLLYTYGSQRPCDTNGGIIIGSPPGYLYGDARYMVSQYGADGISIDSCGFTGAGGGFNIEGDLRQMYVELDQSVNDINANPSIYGGDGTPPPQLFPTRVANISSFGTQWSWQAAEANIIFEGQNTPQDNVADDMGNYWQAYKNCSWINSPGHFYSVINLKESDGTNMTMAEMSVCMAVMGSPMMITATGANPAFNAYYTNSEVLALYQDLAHLPPFVITNLNNNQSGPVVFGRMTASTNSGTAVAVFVNPSSGSPQAFTVSDVESGITSGSPFAVRDPWNHVDLGIVTNTYTITVPANSVALRVFNTQMVARNLYVTGATAVNIVTANSLTVSNGPPVSGDVIAEDGNGKFYPTNAPAVSAANMTGFPAPPTNYEVLYNIYTNIAQTGTNVFLNGAGYPQAKSYTFTLFSTTNVYVNLTNWLLGQTVTLYIYQGSNYSVAYNTNFLAGSMPVKPQIYGQFVPLPTVSTNSLLLAQFQIIPTASGTNAAYLATQEAIP